jgi:DNA-directed RNA polymerase specialized sigma24 family protein
LSKAALNSDNRSVEQVPDRGADPLTRAMWNEFMERVGRAMRALCPEHRAVLLLFLLGYSHQEIAESTQRPPGTVGGIKSRAQRELKRNMEEQAL